MSQQKKLTKQMVQDIGEYFVCFVLSQMGFRAVRTSQNAMGVDILAYGEKTLRPVTIQVKAARQPVTATVCPRKHEQAEEDVHRHPIARFWILVQLHPDDSGQVEHVHIWDSEDKSHLRLLRPRAHKKTVRKITISEQTWDIAADVGKSGDREKWNCLKGGWGRISDFLNAKLTPNPSP